MESYWCIASIKVTDVIECTEKGNTTTYEWLYGEPPQRVEILDSDKIIEVSANEDTVEEIDWDITTNEEIDYDYGITIDESGIEVEAAEETSVAKGNEANLVLDNPNTRNEFLVQLLEVTHFRMWSLISSMNNL